MHARKVVTRRLIDSRRSPLALVRLGVAAVWFSKPSNVWNMMEPILGMHDHFGGQWADDIGSEGYNSGKMGRMILKGQQTRIKL